MGHRTPPFSDDIYRRERLLAMTNKGHPLAHAAAKWDADFSPMKSPPAFPEVFSLRGEHALITGGGTGIGLAVARALHAAGARVVLIGRREPELVEAVRGIGAGASYVVHDI